MLTQMSAEDWDVVLMVFRAVLPRRGDKGRDGTRGKTPGKGYASGMGASGILLKTLTSFRVRTPPFGELPGVLPLLP